MCKAHQVPHHHQCQYPHNFDIPLGSCQHLEPECQSKYCLHISQTQSTHLNEVIENVKIKEMLMAHPDMYNKFFFPSAGPFAYITICA